MYGLNKLDEKIYQKLSLFKVKSNFFIEAGANDGISQSNTAMLEFHKGWSGILVEPNNINFEKAILNRPKSTVIRGALVASNYTEKEVQGIFSDQSVSRFNGLCSGATEEHAKEFPEWLCKVPAIKLADILAKNLLSNQIGFLSLDVEGYELSALDGLNLDIWRPEVIVIEIARWEDANIVKDHTDFLSSKNYICIEDFEPNGHDFMFIDTKRSK